MDGRSTIVVDRWTEYVGCRHGFSDNEDVTRQVWYYG